MKKIFIALSVLLTVILVLTGCSNDKSHMNHDQHQQPNQDEHTNHNQHSTQEKQANVNVNWSFAAHHIEPNKKASLTIEVLDQSGKPVDQFDINHEKKMHLIMVSKDLSSYQHIHPVYLGNGKFKIDVEFPQTGDFKLIADFKPKGQEATSQHHWVKVVGNVPAVQPVQPDKKLTKIVDGKEVTLSFDKELKANQETKLNFHIIDTKSKQPITGLQPYLGAIGHVVILTKDTEKYLHVHPMNEKSTGPDAQFHTKFPKSGVYKIWGEFQYQGKVFITPFVIQVL